MTAIVKHRKVPEQKPSSLFKRGSNSKLASITIPIKFGMDENGNIVDDLNEIRINQKPAYGKGTTIIVEVFDLKNEDAYYKFCGDNLPDEEMKQKFIEKYPDRAKKLRLNITTSNDIMLFDDSEFIGKTGPEIMQLEKQYVMNEQMLFRIEKIRKMMIANKMERYCPDLCLGDGNDS